MSYSWRNLLLPLFLLGGPGFAQTTLPSGSVTDVAVTAKKRQAVQLLDRKIYRVGSDLQSVTGSAADVLNNVPGVDVDADGIVSLRGDSNVTVLLNGKPVTQLNGPTGGTGLQSLAASGIDRIEVMTNPPAQYTAAGSAGVINIITKSPKTGGWSGTSRLNAGLHGRVVAGLDLHYGAGDWNFGATFGLHRDFRQRLVTDQRLAYDSMTSQWTTSRERLTETLHRVTPQIQITAGANFNDAQSVSASISHQQLFGRRFFDQYDISAIPGQPADSDTLRHSDGHEWNEDDAADLQFNQKLAHPDETLDFELQRSVSRERERYHYTNYDFLSPGAPTYDDLRLSLDLTHWEWSTDYTRPIGDRQTFKAGYDLTADDNHFDNAADNIDPATGAAINNSAVTDHFRFSQQINAFYASDRINWTGWELQAGVRAEQTNLAARQLVSGRGLRRNYFGAYPSLQLSHSLNDKNKLTFALSRRLNRPQAEQLDPLIDTQDVNNLRAGNAALLPQDTWSLEAGYSHDDDSLGYGLTAYVRRDRDSITTVSTVVGPDVVLSSLANLPKADSAGLEFNTNAKIAAPLTIKASGNLFDTQIDYEPGGGSSGGLRSTVGLNLKTSLDWKFSGSSSAQASFDRIGQKLTPQGYLGAVNLLSFGYRRQLRPNLALVVTFSDALNGQVLHRVVNTPELADNYSRKQIGQVFYAGVIYGFGGNGKLKSEGFDYDQ